MDCSNCADKTRLARKCPKALRNPQNEALKDQGWKPITEGPKACARLVADLDLELGEWVGDFHRLENYGSYPHSPGDWGAQGVRWAAAMDTIRYSLSVLRAEELEAAKKEAGQKKGNMGGKRRR